jgi:hypothetical protein
MLARKHSEQACGALNCEALNEMVYGKKVPDGEPPDRGEFVACLLVEIGVTAAAVQRGVPDADVAEAGRVVVANRNVSGDIRHVIMIALIHFIVACG